MINREKQKELAARAAVEYVQDGMVVGLGTGSTAAYAIHLISDKIKAGLDVHGVPTSIGVEKMARELGVPISDYTHEPTSVDLVIDGADESDAHLNVVKGGGGALLREKIVAAMSRKVIFIADASKLKTVLGAFPLPVEVMPFGWRSTARFIKSLGAQEVELRKRDGEVFVTDNKNWILDCRFERIAEPETLSKALNAVPGVVENGLFIDLCDVLILADGNGKIQKIE